MLRPLTVCLVALSVLGAGRADLLEGGAGRGGQAPAPSAAATREIAITIDDLPSVSVVFATLEFTGGRGNQEKKPRFPVLLTSC